MSRAILTTVAAGIEIVTGLILMVAPSAFARVLFGADLPQAGQAVGRIAGFALLSLGIACRPGSEAPTAAVSALLIYNLLITAYLIYVGVAGGPVGPLLWPAAALHGLLSVMVLRARFGQPAK
jgi:hypothetical protein